MNWLEKHLNWTTFLFTVFIILVLTFIVVITGDAENAFVNITLFLLFVASFFVYGWVLRQKSRSLWWLLLNWLSIGWIIYMALDNRTLKYTPADRNNVLDLVRLWAHVLQSLDLAMPMQLAEKMSVQQNGPVSSEEFQSAMSDTLTKVETVRSELVDKYQWPVFTDTETNSIVAEINSKTSEFFAYEFEAIRLIRSSMLLVNSLPLISRQGAKDLSKATKKLNRLGMQTWNLLFKLARRYRIPGEEYRQVIANA
jgi:energy-coupling factor transporter transmembrane protein EcfT